MFEIRRADIDDIQEIKQLFRETILNVNRKDYTTAQVECWSARGNDDNVWKERLKEQYFIIAITRNIIVGFAALKMDGYLNSLFVHKDYQNIGVASSLLSEIERYAERNNLRILTADVSITARPFFEKKGYLVMKQQIVDIGVKMSNYKMQKELK